MPSLVATMGDFADQKPKDVLKGLANIGSWFGFALGTDIHPIAQGAAKAVGAFDVPLALSDLATLVQTVQGEVAQPGSQPVRNIVGHSTTFVESTAKAIKWVLGFFKDAVIAPWAALANACGMYNCADLGVKNVQNLTAELNKPNANHNKVTQHALDIAKFVAGFLLNAFAFAGVVAGVVIASPVMLCLSSLAIACTFGAFYFKQEAAPPRV